MDCNTLALLTDGLSGSDIKELCRTAAMFRVREYLQQHDVDSMDRYAARACVRDALSSPLAVKQTRKTILNRNLIELVE